MPDAMLKIQLRVERLEKLIERLRSAPSRVVDVMSVKLNAVLFMLQGKIVREKLSGQMLNRRTGTLAGSVRVEPAHTEGTSIKGSVLAGGGPAFYGKILHEGARPHDVFNVKAKALRWIADQSPQTMFARHVRHPGTIAKPFMTSTLTENAAMIRAELQAALNKELEK
jgi:hypothetical protein